MQPFSLAKVMKKVRKNYVNWIYVVIMDANEPIQFRIFPAQSCLVSIQVKPELLYVKLSESWAIAYL